MENDRVCAAEATADTAEAVDTIATAAGTQGFADFPELALFLAESYGQLLKDRERLKSVVNTGVQPYTKEMAIRDLSSISISYESDRVQTSDISNVPERIAGLLDSGYVEKMNRRLRRDMDETVQEHGYICWKIDVVETAMRERMDKMQQAVFTRIFVRGYTFSQLKKAYKKKLDNKQICRMKDKMLTALADELALAASSRGFEYKYMEMLRKEMERQKEQKEREAGDGWKR